MEATLIDQCSIIVLTKQNIKLSIILKDDVGKRTIENYLRDSSFEKRRLNAIYKVDNHLIGANFKAIVQVY